MPTGLREVRTEFYNGSVETASIRLDKYISSIPREAEVFKLDRAVVELAAGRPQVAEKLLREARDSLDYNSQASLAEKAGSMLTDDTHTAYAGEDYEKILVRAMLAISNLMNGGADATAYALQSSDIQEQIIANGGGRGRAESQAGLQARRPGRVSPRRDQRGQPHRLQRGRAKLDEGMQLGARFPLRPLRRRSGHARPPQSAGQRRALCFRPGGPRAVQGRDDRAGVDDFDVRRQHDRQRHRQAEHPAVDRADQGAQGRGLPQCHEQRAGFGRRPARRPDGHDHRRGQAGRRAIRGDLSARRRAGGRPPRGQGRHHLRREGSHARCRRTPGPTWPSMWAASSGRRANRPIAAAGACYPIASRCCGSSCRPAIIRSTCSPTAATAALPAPTRPFASSRAATRISWACSPTGTRSAS